MSLLVFYLWQTYSENTKLSINSSGNGTNQHLRKPEVLLSDWPFQQILNWQEPQAKKPIMDVWLVVCMRRRRQQETDRKIPKNQLLSFRSCCLPASNCHISATLLRSQCWACMRHFLCNYPDQGLALWSSQGAKKQTRQEGGACDLVRPISSHNCHNLGHTYHAIIGH